MSETRHLRKADVVDHPMKQFGLWFQTVLDAGFVEPYAMTLATCGEEGWPQARVVLMKGYDDRGITFFTNYQSAKGHQLASCPRASLLFFWDKLERQVRLVGEVEKTSTEESDEYFSSRPRGSQLGAWASSQSEVLAGRKALEVEVERVTQSWEGRDVERPPHWGGFRVCPISVEFWQGQPSRLHDRIRYRKQEGGDWLLERLSP